MMGGYRYRSDDLARVLGAWGSALGDQTSAHVEGSVLELRRTWDRFLAAVWVVVVLVVAGASSLALTCWVVVAFDRFPVYYEVLASLAPALLLGALGLRHARPRETLIDRSTRTLWSGGARRPLDPPALVLTRDVVGTSAFDVHLALRHGGTVLRLRGVRGNEAARAKAIAVALAAWLDGSLVERTSRATLEALYEADVRHGLVRGAAEPAASSVPRAPSRARRRLAMAVDVAIFSVALLDAL